MFSLTAFFGDWSLLILRIVFGAIFVFHGWPKFRHMKTAATNFSSMGFRPGFFWGPLVAIVEFAGGLLFFAGFYTQVAAAFIAAEFLVIIVWKIAKWQPFIGGLELDLLIFAVALVLFTNGGGAFSIDQLISLGY